MNNNFQNDVNITGYVFSVNLRSGVTKPTSQWNPNEAYLSGTVNVAVDDEALTVVPVNFYACEHRNDKNGNRVVNDNYTTLHTLLSAQTYEEVGTQATKVRIAASFDTNDFYSTRSNDLVSATRANGRFIHIAQPNNKVGLASFEANMIATGVSEQTPEGRDPYLEIRGYVFNFRGSKVFPVRFECRDQNGIDFIQSLEISGKDPVTMSVWGNIQTTIIEMPSEEEKVSSGFGVRPSTTSAMTRTIRSYVITGADTDHCPEFGSVSPFTKNDLKRLVDERNVMLEGLKQNGSRKAPVAPQKTQPSYSTFVDYNSDDDDIPF